MKCLGLTGSRARLWAAPAAFAMALTAAACDGDEDDDHDHAAEEAPAKSTDDKAAGAKATGDKATGDKAGTDKTSGATADKGGDAKPAGSDLEPSIVALSKSGHDRLYGVTYGADGNLYAVGQVADGVEATTDFSFAVAKFTPEGKLDASFGKDGVATKNVAVGGTVRENARGIVVQSTGKIVIAGAAEHDPKAEGLAAQDTDIALVRFESDGTLDKSFGKDGVVVLDLNSGIEGKDMMGMPAWQSGDSQWALALASDDRLIVHGSQRAEGKTAEGEPRADADWALLRLTADGELDASFGDKGKVTLDIAEAGASPRGVSVLADDSVIATGYLSSTALGEDTQQPVIYKVDAKGAFDAKFATKDAWTAPGVWHDFAVKPPLRAEAYGAALQGDKLVTMGYGLSPKEGATTTDWVSFRFTASGERDLSYGTDGATYIDADGYGDNGRFVLVLPDERVLGIGGGRLAPAEPLAMGTQPPTDGMIVMLKADGKPDESFAKGGFKLVDMGGNDFFWAGAVSPDKKHAAIVGLAGGATMNVDDDDSALLLLSL